MLRTTPHDGQLCVTGGASRPWLGSQEAAPVIEHIAREELVCSPRIAAKLFGGFSERAGRLSNDGAPSAALTGRERQVLDCIRLGHSNKQIAQKLNIAEPTVKNHVHHLLEKLARHDDGFRIDERPAREATIISAGVPGC